MMIVYILIAILMFGFMIFTHELGHYTFARIFHVKIFEFSLGMGPKLLSRVSKKNGDSLFLASFSRRRFCLHGGRG